MQLCFAADPANFKTYRGEEVHNARLTADEVREIRNLSAAGWTSREIAIEISCKVAPRQIRAILGGRCWRHVR